MGKSKTKAAKSDENARKNIHLSKYFTKAFLWDVIQNPYYLPYISVVLIIVEIFVNVLIINKVKYTEIDWVAYMQEVEGFLNGTLDYQFLKGDTGPLVYPAGFVYIYSVFYFITNRGENIVVAQYLFLVIYILQLCLVFRIYSKTAKVPPFALVISVLTSYRIHSIYVLRLFNDPIAVLFFYASLNAFISNQWTLGSIFFSLAVSVKMNILLYAPCLLVAYLMNLTLKQTFTNLFLCGFVQLVVGLPFLYANPISYLKGSFDLGRVFLYKWTVNYRFLDESIFVSRNFHIALLVLHLSLLVAFFPSIKLYLSSYAKLDQVARDVTRSMKTKKQKFDTHIDFSRKAQLMVLPFFATNLVGIACARSLHYQFYSWYFHSLLYLVYCTNYSKMLGFLLLGVMEMCWNTYPSTAWSSLTLHACHAILLWGVYKYMGNCK